MNIKQLQSVILIVSISFLAMPLTSCAGRTSAVADSPPAQTTADTGAPGAAGPATVYFTSDISPAGLMSVYEALGREMEGRVAVKIHTGEPGGKNFLQPALIKDLVQSVSGTIVESNAGMWRRASAALHKQVAADHGFTAIAPVDILDEDGEITLPVYGGKQLKKNFVGSHFPNYDSWIILSHFKGHPGGGFGGAIKNMSIGIASYNGKMYLHTAGTASDPAELWRRATADLTVWNNLAEQDDYLESMAEAAKSVADNRGEKILYINVMNRLSVDCDCGPSPAEPDMLDIGILASLDPVALDKACVDLVYAAPDGASLIERIESRNGSHTLDHAAAIGLGSLQYELVKLNG
jgi:uncharacterized Fe-S center protein